ncbi:MAG TPA: hypothetical protein VFR81_05685 [Longimicrobium sp.]|nr:hypothetical protein [Longimicrobium sp.]
MRRASWILGSLTLVTIAACGGGNRPDATGGTGSETGTMGGDTTTLAPGAATMDTALTGTGTTGIDTAAMDTAQTR